MPAIKVNRHHEAIRAETLEWLNNIVIGLNLCPFAAPALARDKIDCVVSDSIDQDALTADLDHELLRLTDDLGPDTTLLIIPEMLQHFAAFNDYLDIADALLEARNLEGEIQIATFHPRYQFADEPPDDRSHWTNRSPYPMLHLLREPDVAQAVARHPDAEGIPERNQKMLRSMSDERWRALFKPR